jgi:hypothetical protein
MRRDNSKATSHAAQLRVTQHCVNFIMPGSGCAAAASCMRGRNARAAMQASAKDYISLMRRNGKKKSEKIKMITC